MERLLDQFPVVELTNVGLEQVRYRADRMVIPAVSQDIFRAVTENCHHPPPGTANRARRSSMLPAGRVGRGRERYCDHDRHRLRGLADIA